MQQSVQVPACKNRIREPDGQRGLACMTGIHRSDIIADRRGQPVRIGLAYKVDWARVRDLQRPVSVKALAIEAASAAVSSAAASMPNTDERI